ncbi:MAG: hypothetical protein ACLT0Y_01460 [Christensenellales bacterium]
MATRMPVPGRTRQSAVKISATMPAARHRMNQSIPKRKERYAIDKPPPIYNPPHRLMTNKAMLSFQADKTNSTETTPMAMNTGIDVKLSPMVLQINSATPLPTKMLNNAPNSLGLLLQAKRQTRRSKPKAGKRQESVYSCRHTPIFVSTIHKKPIYIVAYFVNKINKAGKGEKKTLKNVFFS